jgi:excisionase family DNA binding protein
VSQQTDDPLWSVEDVAAYLRVPVETLYTWRKRHYGPRAARVGRHLRYDPADVRAFFHQQAA